MLDTGEVEKMSEPIAYSLKVGCSVDAIKESLFANGVVIIDEFLVSDAVAKLKEEVERLVYLDHPKHLTEGACQLGRFQTAELETFDASAILAFAMFERH